MSAIYMHKGDEIEALACDGLLPAEFSKPEFKHPLPSMFAPAEHMPIRQKTPTQTPQVVGDRIFEEQEEHGIINRTSLSKDVSTSSSIPTIDEATASSLLEPTKSEEQLSPVYDGTALDLSKLPHAMATRLATAKSLADSFSAYKNKSFSSTESTPTANLTSKGGALEKYSKPPSLSTAEQGAALELLAQNDRTSFTRLDIKDHFLWAAYSGHELVIRLLLTDWVYHKRYRNTNRHGGRSWTTHEVQLQNVDMNVSGDRMHTALHLAATRGHSRIVKILLDCGASQYGRAKGVDADGNYTLLGLGQTPIECAIASRDVETVTPFIQLGIAGHGLDPAGRSLLHHAVTSENKQVVEMILNADFDVQATSNDGTTALHIASAAGHLEIVDLLLSRGANANAEDQNGSSPILLAIARGDNRCISKLLDAGASLRT